ncbi:hypothetical protein NPIL_182171, partial [Nephila pilipes]
MKFLYGQNHDGLIYDWVYQGDRNFPRCYLHRQVDPAPGVKIRVVDASGRLPSGTLEGTLTDLGDYDQCLDVIQPKKSKHVSIQGQYCTLEVQPVLPALRNSVSMNTRVLNFGNISSDS